MNLKFVFHRVSSAATAPIAFIGKNITELLTAEHIAVITITGIIRLKDAAVLLMKESGN